MGFRTVKFGICFVLTVIWQSSVSQVYFIDVAQEVGIDHYSVPHRAFGALGMGGGVAWLDFDNDGWQDLYLTGGSQSDKLYRNSGDGTFTDYSQLAGIYNADPNFITLGVASADINRDGFSDLLVTTYELLANLVFINQGDGTFIEMGAELGITDNAYSAAVSVGDFNEDGWPDLYYSNWRTMSEFGWPEQSAYPNRLYVNDGDGTFTDVTPASILWSENGCGLASAFTDFDLDGDIDLMVTNDFGTLPWSDANRLFENSNGSFTDVSLSTQFNGSMHAMGIAIADYDEDQDLDYYITDIGTNPLYKNDGNIFSDVAEIAGVQSRYNLIDTVGAQVDSSWGWGTAFFDYDNDTYVDLFSSNGRLFTNFTSAVVDQNRLFKNNEASGTFDDVSVITGMDNSSRNRGCAVADYDQDGDLDMVVVTVDTLGGVGRTVLMKNEGGNNNNWLEVSLTGSASNLDALGSVLYLNVDGRTIIREIDSGGSSYSSHHSKVAHFGLGSYQVIDSLRIVWPNGIEEVQSQIAVNQKIQVVENQVPVAIEENEGTNYVLYPNPVQDKLWLRFIDGNSNLVATEPTIVEIISVYGTVSQRGLCENSPCQLDAGELENGSYRLRVLLSDGSQVIQPFIVLR